jgi:SSS family transporter
MIIHPTFVKYLLNQHYGTMGILDIVVVIFFSLGIVCAGLAFTKQGKNMKSFFAAGGSMPWYMSGLSLFMGFFSAGTFVVWGSVAYSQGWVAVTIQWTMAVAGFVVGTFIAPRWHRTGALTVAEYINKRLGASTQKIYTYLFLFLSLFLTASFLYPIAKIVQVSTGLPLEPCILLLSVFCVLYVSAGGLRAVVVTDILQFVILTIAVIIVIPLSLHQIDGLSALLHSAPDTFFNLVNAEYSIGFIIAFAVYNTVFLGGNWAYVQRYTCVQTANDAKKAGWLFGVLYIVSPVLWMLPPMLYKTINPTLAGLEAEGAYLLMCKEVLTSGIMGLMIGGMIFATTSAINSKLNIVAGVFTNDIFKRLKPNSPDKTLMFSARLSTIAFGILTIIITMLIPKMGGVVNLVITLAALTGVPLYLPVVWTLFSKRQTATSNLTTTILSLAVNGIFKFVTPIFGFSLNRAEEMIVGVTLPILCLVVFELYYVFKKKISNRYETYTGWEKENHRQKQNITPEVIRAINKENKFSNKIVGYGIAITGFIVALLGGVSSSGVALVVTTGIVFAMLGMYLIKRSSNRR